MYLKVRGLVIRTAAYNDHDTLITLLTSDYGKIVARVRGLRRKNNPLTAPCQLLAYGEYTLFESRGRYTVNEAHSIELFEPLRRDLLLLSLATYFTQVAEVIAQEDQPNPELLSLVLNCIFCLSSCDIPIIQVKAVFELRLACLAGYCPDLHGCIQCGNLFPNRLDLSQGHLECAGCRSTVSGAIRMPLTNSTLDAMRYICNADSKHILSFSVGQKTLEELSGITESYLSTQLEQGFSALDFFKSLQITV